MAQNDPKSTPPPSAPTDLSARSTALWDAVNEALEFTPAEVELLLEALRALDEADRAREQIAVDGPTVLDRSGGTKVHPLADVVHRRRAFFQQTVRALGLTETLDPKGR